MLRMRKIVSLLLATIAVPLSTFCSTLSQDDIMFSATCHNLSNILPKIRTAGNVVFDDEANEFLDYVIDFLSNNECGLSLNDPIGMYLFHDKDDDNDVERSFSALCVAKISDREIVDGPLSSQFFTKTINEWVIFSDDEQILSNDDLSTYIISDITTRPPNDLVINVYKKYAKELLSAIESEMSLPSELSEEQQAIINNTIQSAQTQLNDSEKIYITIDMKENELSTQFVTTAKPGTSLHDLFSNFSRKQLTLCFPPINEASEFAVQECCDNDTSLWDMLSICNDIPLNNDTTNTANHDQPLLVTIGTILGRPSLKEWGMLVTSHEEQYGYLLLEHDCSNTLKSTLHTMPEWEVVDDVSTQWTILHNKQMMANNMSDWIAYHDNIILFFTGTNYENPLSQWICLCEEGCTPGEQGTCTSLQMNLPHGTYDQLNQSDRLQAQCNNGNLIINSIVQYTKNGMMYIHTNIPFETLHSVYGILSTMMEQSCCSSNNN